MRSSVTNILGFGVSAAICVLAVWGVAAVIAIPGELASSQANAAEQSLADLLDRVRGLKTELAAVPANGPDARLDTEGSAEDSLQRLQERVRDLVTGAGGALLLSQTSSDPVAPGLEAVHVTARVRMSEPALMTFVRSIESARPQVVFDQLEATPTPGDTTGNVDVALVLTSVHRSAI